MAWIFTFALFASAGLLFLVQPMAARWALPVFGGTPAVWTSAMLMFQLLLLAGYAYAHALANWLSPRRQVLVHAIVMIVCGLALPIALPDAVRAWAVDAQGQTGGSLRVLVVLGVTAGGPFFAVSTLGPLLQRWFSRTGHSRAHDPYFLYAASNAGSLLGLLGYPLIVEPAFGLGAQGWWWAGGYAGLVLMVIACGLLVRNPPTSPPLSPSLTVGARQEDDKKPSSATSNACEKGEHLTWRTRLGWIALAFVPSSLMLGVTLKLTTDVAAFPLLWVLPLSVYLLTFVLAFSQQKGDPGRFPAVLWWVLAPALAVAMVGSTLLPVVISLPLHLLGLLVGGLVCHGRLAATRPPAKYLTEFYLLLSVGGALGGVFNALLAPAIFSDVWEYPIALSLVGVAAVTSTKHAAQWRWAIVIGVCTLIALIVGGRWMVRVIPDMPALAALGPLVLVALVLAWRKHPAWSAAVLAALFLGSPRAFETTSRERTRSFFGVHTVSTSPDGSLRIYAHGTTRHGMQRLDPNADPRDVAYYGIHGPVGDVFGVVNPKRFAVIGLGIGTLVAYGLPGAHADLIEIDPEVVRIARDPEAFTYLRDAVCSYDVIVADGRLAIEAAEHSSYDLIVLDAFSSDSIPVHLVTLEAFEVYQRALKPDGLILMNISNRSMNLRPIVAALARATGLSVKARDDLALDPESGKRPSWRFPSQWAVFSRDGSKLETLDERWRSLEAEPSQKVWTDDYANPLSVIRWR